MPLLILILLSGMAHCAMGSARVLVSLYALHLQASSLTVGILVGLFGFFPMLLAVPIGRLVDRFGSRWPIRIGSVMLLAGTLIPWWMPTLGALYITASLIGAGFVSVHVATQHLVGVLSKPETRTRDYGHLSIGYSASSFIGPMSAGFAIDLVGYRSAFMLFAGMAGVVLLIAFSGKVPESGVAASRGPKSKGKLLDLLLEPRMRAIYVVGILLAAAWDLYVFVVPVYGTHLGFSASTIGVILGTFAAATFTVRLVMPMLSRRYSEWQILRAAMYCAGLSYLALPFISQAPLFMLFSLFLGSAVGAAQPNLLSLLHVASPPGRAGEALGLRVTITNAGQSFLPLLFGAAGTALGMMPVFWTIAALIGLGIPMANREKHVAALAERLAAESDVPVMGDTPPLKRAEQQE